MQIGIALDERLGLTLIEQRSLVQSARALGYECAWTNAGVRAPDAFHTCVQWSQAVDNALGTGISIVPAPAWTAATLASQAATVGQLTGGRFILGIGTGGAYTESFRRMYGLPNAPIVSLMRDYLRIIRSLLAGEQVDYAGPTLCVQGVQIGAHFQPVPVYLAALGPQMIRLAGEAADGILPNWATPEQIEWIRQRLVEGATRADRNPHDLRVVQYIRICVDDDVTAARRAYGAQVLQYALAHPGGSRETGYRAHFGRMGFDAPLKNLEERRDAGEPMNQLIDRIPEDMLSAVGYYGPARGAAAAFRRLSHGLDTALVRVITTVPDQARALRVLEACQPSLVTAPAQPAAPGG